MNRTRGSTPFQRLALACQVYLGLPSWVALLLLVIALALLTHWLPRLQAQRVQLEEARRQQEFAQTGSAAAPGGAARQRTADALLPLPSRHQEDLGVLLRTARNHGLTWNRADYAMELGGTFASSTAVLKLRLFLPVAGSALQVSGFLGEALRLLPNASVEDLALGDEAGRPADAARLRLVLLYRDTRP